MDPFVFLRAPLRGTRSPKRSAKHNSSAGFCAMLGPGKHANHTRGAAKIEKFVYTSMVRTDTTILDHSRVFLSILRAPQRNLISENRRPPSNWSSGFCAMLGPGKRANHTIGVAKMREFRALGPHEPSQDLQRSSQDLSRPSQTPPCTL